MKVQETKSALLPGAWIVNPKDKGRKSIKSGNVYLDNNEEFQIEIHNPLKECVLADIRLNGQSISKTGLVVKPGQRVYLDCFIDDKKKFTFQTYDVDGSQESQEAIENNGLMEVFFYKEEVVSLKNWSEKLREVVVKEYYPIYVDRYPSWYPYYRPGYPWYGGCTTTIYGGSITTNGNFPMSGSTTGNSFTLSSGSTLCGGVTNTAMYSSNMTPTSDVNFNFDTGQLNLINDGSFNSQKIKINETYQDNSVETGRIEKGEKSNQQFTEIDMDFEKNYIHHIVFQLLPTSRKPAEVDTKKVSDKLVVGHQAADLIVKLKDLFDGGIITQSEFDEKRKELLSRI